MKYILPILTLFCSFAAIDSVRNHREQQMQLESVVSASRPIHDKETRKRVRLHKTQVVAAAWNTEDENARTSPIHDKETRKRVRPHKTQVTAAAWNTEDENTRTNGENTKMRTQSKSKSVDNKPETKWSALPSKAGKGAKTKNGKSIDSRIPQGATADKTIKSKQSKIGKQASSRYRPHTSPRRPHTSPNRNQGDNANTPSVRIVLNEMVGFLGHFAFFLLYFKAGSKAIVVAHTAAYSIAYTSSILDQATGTG